MWGRRFRLPTDLSQELGPPFRLVVPGGISVRRSIAAHQASESDETDKADPAEVVIATVAI